MEQNYLHGLAPARPEIYKLHMSFRTPDISFNIELEFLNSGTKKLYFLVDN